MAGSDEGTFTGYENFIAATPKLEFGNEMNIPKKVIANIIRETDFMNSLGNQDDRTATMGLLRGVRRLRPHWLTSVVYIELLKPFNSEIMELTGYSVEDIYNSLNVALAKVGTLKETPMELGYFVKSASIYWRNINSPADLWNIGFVNYDEWSWAIAHTLPEVIYNRLCKDLPKTLKYFDKKKGETIERYVRDKFSKFLKGCNCYPNSYIGQNEKDLICICGDAGIAIESKSLKYRTGSVYRSLSLAYGDSSPLRIGLEQVVESMKILEGGGVLIHNGKSVNITPKKIYVGAIITDNVYSPLLKGNIDPIDSSDKTMTAFPSNVWVGSVFDIDFLMMNSNFKTILLHYLSRFRTKRNMRFTDEPESWGFYSISPFLPGVGRDTKPNYIGNGYNWEKFLNSKPEDNIPLWISRLDRIKYLDERNKISKAFDVIEKSYSTYNRIIQKDTSNFKNSEHGREVLRKLK